MYKRQVLYVVAAALQLILVPACYGGAAILCAIWVYRRKLKEPLAILDAASARIAADQLDFTVSYDSRDEMGRPVSYTHLDVYKRQEQV